MNTNNLFLDYERNMYNAYQRDGSNFNHATYMKTYPLPTGYQPTGFLNQYPAFSQFHSKTVNGVPVSGMNDAHLAWERNMYSAYEREGSNFNHATYLRTYPQPAGYRPTGFLNQYPHFKQFHTTTVTTTTTQTAPVSNIIQKDAVITNVVDKAVLGNVIEKQNVEVIHKPVVQEIHEQRIIELEKQNIIKNVTQDTVVQRQTDATRYEEVGNRDLEAERLRLASLNVAQAPVITREAGAMNEVRQGEVVAQVVRQEHIERHVQPVITEVREQNIVKEVLHPVVRKVHEETIIREVSGTTMAAPLVGQQNINMVGTTQGINANNDLFLGWERNMYSAYERDGSNWNREKWLLANPQPAGYRPTGFFNSYPAFSQYHTSTLGNNTLGNNDLYLGWERNMYGAYQRDGSNWNREKWLLANPQPMGYRPTGFFNQYPAFSQYHTTTTVNGVPVNNQNDQYLGWERNMYSAYERDGSNWNREKWLLANPQPLGYQPTGFLNQYPAFSQFHHTNVVEGGKLPKKPTDLSKYDGAINPVAVINPSENLKHQPTDGTVVPTTTLGEAPAHTHEVLKGAAAGAAIGSVVPVVGTVVGGVIGAIGGAIVKNKHIKEGTHAFKE